MKSKTPSQGGPNEGTRQLTLRVLPDAFAICRMHPRARIPRWIHDADVYSATRTHDALTLVAPQKVVPNGVHQEGERRMVQVVGEFDLEEIGVLNAVTGPLADAKISIYVLSTFFTDYVMLRDEDLDDALDALEDAGHDVVEDEEEPVAAEAAEDDEDDESDEEETVRLTAQAAVSSDQTFESLMRTAVDDEEVDEDDEEDEEDEDEDWDDDEEEDDTDTDGKTTPTDRRRRRRRRRRRHRLGRRRRRGDEEPEDEDDEEPDEEEPEEDEDEEEPEEDEDEEEPKEDAPSDHLAADDLPADEREPVDEDDLEEGMFTGAIPQDGQE